MANNNNKFYLLQYTHEQIQTLLKKIDDGWVLNESDYDQLINIIGLDNISTFSGWYDDLQGKPDLNAIVENTVNDANGLIVQNIRDFVLEQDAAILNELEILAAEIATKASKVELSNGLAQKSDIYHNHNLDYARKDLEHDHDNKTVIDSITEANIHSWTENVLNLAAFKIEAFEKFAQLLDVINMLEGKANVVHFHDAQYASKASEHAHNNLDLLNAITLLDISNWNANIDKANTLEGLLNIVMGELDTAEEAILAMKAEGVTKNELDSKLMSYAKLTEMKDYVAQELDSYYNKENIDQLLELKVDKEDGKGLSTNDLTNELKALLDEVLNDTNNTDKTVNEFVLDRIDNALADPGSELAKALANKVEKELIDPADESKGYKVLSTNDLTDELKALLDEILNGNDVDGDGVISVLDYINKAIDDDIANETEVGALGNLFANKMDKQFSADGSEKVLSENDFADSYKALLDEVLGNAASTDMTSFINKVISDSIIDENNNDGNIFSIGEMLINKVDKDKFATLDKDPAGNITVVADDKADFDASTEIKESDAKLINPDFVIGDKLAEVEKDMGLSEVPFTEEQNNFLNQVMREGATNDDKVKAIIQDSINAVEDDGNGNMVPVAGSINEALSIRDDLIANKVDKEEGAVLADNQNGSEGLLVVASGAVTDPDTQIAIDDPRLNGSGAVEGNYINIIQKGLSSNDYTDAEKEKLASIELITVDQINAAFIAAGFSI